MSAWTKVENSAIAVRSGIFVFLNAGRAPSTGPGSPSSFILRREMRRVLMGAGSGLDLVVFARGYLTRFERDYAAMNAVYQSYFAPTKLPARTCVGVTALARGALVELHLLAPQAQSSQPQ